MTASSVQQVTAHFQRALRQFWRRWGSAELARRSGLTSAQVEAALDPAATPDLASQAALATAAGYDYAQFLLLGQRLVEGQQAASPQDRVLPAMSPHQGGPADLLLHLASSFRLAESEPELCVRICQGLVEMLGFQRACLLLKEGDALLTTCLHWPGGDGAALLEALRSEPPSLADDPMVYESFAVGRALPLVVGQEDLLSPAVRGILGEGCQVALAPLFSEREFLGALAADHGPLGLCCGQEEDLRLLEAAAVLAGTLLGSLRLYAELERKNRELDLHLRELTVVGELTRVLNQVKEPAEVARRMLSFLALTLEADYGFLFLFNFKARQLHLVGSHGLTGVRQEAWSRLDGVEPALLDPTGSQVLEGADLRRLLPGLDGPALLRVIYTRQRAVGIWGLGRNDPGNPFQSGEERVLATADDQMSVALNSMRLRLLASTDYLTGLFTRGHFVEVLEQELRLAHFLGQPLGLVLMDADHFKNVNDTYGHQAGDQVLASLGHILRACTRADDTCARIGGEEFAVILPRCDLEGTRAAAEKIREQVARQPVPYRGQSLSLTVSLGVAVLEPGQEATREELVNRADQALYRAKRGGRDRVVVWEPGPEKAWGSLD